MTIPRFRFAPSPTGFLHIGGARTAIFNYLLARNLGGRFLIRIEDTDRERSHREYEDDILDALKWMGLSWDEEPLRQSTRRSFHREAVEELLDRGAAYHCFLPPEQASEMKQQLMKDGISTGFRSPHRNLEPDEVERRIAEGIPYAVRFKVPGTSVIIRDGVHGTIETAGETIEDFVIMRTDHTPTYNLSVVVDDYDMGITHVVRGDDHISNTPKQILIYEALGWPIPEFAHVPLILGPDKKRLSKRHGATALTEYRAKGYLPDALLCFLALLGWSPGDDREIMSREELIESFSIQGINKTSAVFDETKLLWMNGEFLTGLPDMEIVRQLQQPFAERVQQGIFPNGTGRMLPVAVRLLKSRARLPLDILERGDFFFRDPETLDSKAAKKRLKDEAIPEWLDQLAERFEQLDELTEANSEEAIRELSETLEIGGGKLIHPVRLAVSGQGGGPGLFEMLQALGRDTVVRRLHWLAGVLREHGIPPALDSKEE